MATPSDPVADRRSPSLSGRGSDEYAVPLTYEAAIAGIYASSYGPRSLNA
jgi:hypothetical protein